MSTIRTAVTVMTAVTLWAGQATAQTLTTDPQPATNQPRGVSEDVRPWSFSASAFAYFVPDDRNYVAPTFTADRDQLHLEARYNYEDLETGSVFAGYNFMVGEELVFEGTWLLGSVFGNTTGIAPGYKLALSYRRFELYTEGEYLLNLDDSSENFIYSWSELTYSPTDWFRAGLVAQRTRAYATDLDIQRGLLLGFSNKQVDLAAYLFNLGWDDPTVVFSVGVYF